MCLALALAKINLSLSVDVALTGDPLRRHSSCLCSCLYSPQTFVSALEATNLLCLNTTFSSVRRP